jgi:hypothetical protein
MLGDRAYRALGLAELKRAASQLDLLAEDEP